MQIVNNKIKKREAKVYNYSGIALYQRTSSHWSFSWCLYSLQIFFSRYQRLKDNDVLFVCGSDEHGVAITMKARKEGITPQEVVDKYNKIIKDSFEEFGISFDIYSRTSNKVHHETAQEFFLNLHEKGEFIEKNISTIL